MSLAKVFFLIKGNLTISTSSRSILLIILTVVHTLPCIPLSMIANLCLGTL
jgi:hypothetical protein